MKDVQQVLAGLAPGEPDELTDKLVHELVLSLLRRPDLKELRDNQSAFMRTTIELLVAATEKVTADAEYTRRYAEGADDGADAADRREAAKRAVARRWQNL
jgi:hypothetical protein